MDSEQILEELKAQRDRLQNAIDILEPRPDGRRKHKALNGRRKKRRLSPAARRRISEAMRQRWEARKKAEKTSL
jgi:hypothetical protein